MPETTLSRIDELLEGAQADVDDPDTIYKIRNARQLVGVLEQRHADLDDALDETITDEQVLNNLRDLGYL
ncbi:hypothetical protein BRC76_03250 [Halobacteriales archaeon QH_8_67_36]|nr:MAG: hypothetical protein BRC76_03250 [Halobacteriales archaeon QH_8_67_36]